MTDKKYNHMFDVAFAFDSDHDYDDLRAGELLQALKKRLSDLERYYMEGDDSIDAFGHLETVDMEED